MSVKIWIAVTTIPLALLAGFFAFLYFKQKKKTTALNSLLRTTRLDHAKTLDSIRIAQIRREREISDIITGYGNSILDGIHRLNNLAEYIRKTEASTKSGAENKY